MIIEPFGKVEYHSREKHWFGYVENISPHNKVDLSISVDSQKRNLDEKVELIKRFAADYDSIVSKLYDLAFMSYKDTMFAVTRDEIEKLYFLIGVDLQEDNRTWWLVLEPHFSLPSIYNHFLRFTMVDREIIWMNFDITPASY